MNCSVPIFPGLDYEPVGFGQLIQLSPTGRLAFVTICGILSAYAVASNGFVIFAVNAHKPLKVRCSNLWLSALAMTEIIVAMLVTPVAIYYNLFGAWTLGVAGCKVQGGILNLR